MRQQKVSAKMKEISAAFECLLARSLCPKSCAQDWLVAAFEGAGGVETRILDTAPIAQQKWELEKMGACGSLGIRL